LQEILINISLIIIITVAALYALLILFFSFSWMKIKPWETHVGKGKTKVSVIVPVRNESENIIRCLDCLTAQEYPKNLFEIIICDDSSSDNTTGLVKGYIKSHLSSQIKLIELSHTQIIYKKQAMAEAVAVAGGELIITTDGDCTMGEKWISAIVGFYEEKKHVFIAGPVIFNDDKTVFTDLQSLEFMSLVSTGLGSVEGNFPVMCNGANLAYSRKAFLGVKGYAGNTEYVSGDDIFLLQKMKAKYPGRIGVIKSEEAVVYTPAQKDLKSFISQRLRWVSKSRGYRSFPALGTSVVIYLMNLLILVNAALSFFSYRAFVFFIILISVKIIFDLPVLINITSFARRTKLLAYYIPLQILYIIYVTLIGLAGNFVKYQWKGRKIV
jgi:cellulose synthase/poly-beta-1,6-N-acetylglucosamine synthase-like glycosyltransferase